MTNCGMIYNKGNHTHYKLLFKQTLPSCLVNFLLHYVQLGSKSKYVFWFYAFDINLAIDY